MKGATVSDLNCHGNMAIWPIFIAPCILQKAKNMKMLAHGNIANKI
jgi:hypothetical protein